MEDFIAHNIGVLVSLFITLLAGAIGYGALKTDVKNQGTRLDNIEDVMTKMQDILIKVAVQDERLTAMDQRSLMQGQRIDNLAAMIPMRIEESLKMANGRMDDMSRRIDAITNRWKPSEVNRSS